MNAVIYEIKDAKDNRYGKSLILDNHTLKYYRFIANIPILHNTRVDNL